MNMKSAVHGVIAIILFSLFCVSTGFAAPAAGQPTANSNPANGFSIGILGGLGFTLVDRQETDTTSVPGIPVGNRDTRTETSMNGAIFYGFNIGYSFPLSQLYSLTPIFNFNLLSGVENESKVPIAATPVQIENLLKLKEQYNLILELNRLLGSNFSINVGLGLSWLNATTSLKAFSTDTAVDSSATFQGNKTLFGGVAELGLQYFISHHSSITLNLDNYFYFGNNKLPDEAFSITDGTSDLDNVQNRSLLLYLPAITVVYSYRF